MILAVTGSRDGLSQAQRRQAKRLLRNLAPERLHHGDCVGVDSDVHVLAEAMGIPITIHPPDVAARRAFRESGDVREVHPYLLRNRLMVDEVDVLLAFPDGVERTRSGTWSTVRYAKQSHRRIIICYPDGKIVQVRGS